MSDRPPAPAHSFVDVDAPLGDAVSWMSVTGITTGTSETTFSPNLTLTRAQIAAFLWLLDGTPTPAADHTFRDVVTGWQQDPVSWMSAEEITTGTSETTFSPEQTLNRAQLVTFLYRYNNTPTVTIDPAPPTCDVPTGTFKAISAGSRHSCAIRSDDTAACWGYNYDGEAEAPEGTFKAISAGSRHSCAIRSDDTAACWGYNYDGEAEAPEGTFKAISAGSRHSCAIRSDDTAACWGYNYDGEAEAPEGTFKAISAGSRHSCAIRSDDTAACWGSYVI